MQFCVFNVDVSSCGLLTEQVSYVIVSFVTCTGDVNISAEQTAVWPSSAVTCTV